MADHRDTPADETLTSGRAVPADQPGYAEDRREVVGREREEHGGIKVGSAFFGWLSATGMAVLLSGIVAATGLVAGDTTGNDTATETADALDLSADSLGVLGIVVVLGIWFVAYYCGGYVAGRMARFDGLKQGLGVWLWSIVVALVLGALTAAFGSDYTGTRGMPSVSFEGSTTTALVVAAVVVLLTGLVGAVLGGLAGMRFHRRVDRTGLGR